MKRSPISLQIAAVVFGTLVSAAAHAEPILKGKDINEKNLIEALTPMPAAADEAEPEVRTRSIKVMRDAPSAKPGEAAVKAAARTPEKKASASLLITFETNSAELTPRALSSLDVVAKALQADRLAEFKFSIEGHADPRGASEQNLQLSQARAESVVELPGQPAQHRPRTSQADRQGFQRTGQYPACRRAGKPPGDDHHPARAIVRVRRLPHGDAASS